MLKRAVEVDATVAREGMEFGVISREVAVGGQLLTLRGLGGEYPEIFLPLHGAHMAHNAAVALAAVEAFFGVGAEHARTLDIDAVRAAFAAVSSPGRLEVGAHQPHGPAGRRAQPGRRAGRRRGRHRGVRFQPAGGRRRRQRGQGRRGAAGGVRADLRRGRGDPNSSHRAMDADELAAVAVEVFGDERVQVEPRLDDALEAAITLAEEEGEFSGAGVLVTGSVITVGEARLLMGRN